MAAGAVHTLVHLVQFFALLFEKPFPYTSVLKGRCVWAATISTAVAGFMRAPGFDMDLRPSFFLQGLAILLHQVGI